MTRTMMMTSAERDVRSDASADSSSRAEISRASGTRLSSRSRYSHAFSLRPAFRSQIARVQPNRTRCDPFRPNESGEDRTSPGTTTEFAHDRQRREQPSRTVDVWESHMYDSLAESLVVTEGDPNFLEFSQRSHPGRSTRSSKTRVWGSLHAGAASSLALPL